MSYPDRKDFLTESEKSNGRNLHRSDTKWDRREASYYGPDFQNVERELSSSFIPVAEEPHKKRPDTYPTHVQKDFDYYKGCEDAATRARHEVDRSIHAIPKGPPTTEKVERILETKERLYNTRRLANESAQGRSGFMHKYPYAYETFEEEGHKEAIKNRLGQARNIRTLESKYQHDIDLANTLLRGEKPRGIPKKEFKKDLV